MRAPCNTMFEGSGLAPCKIDNTDSRCVTQALQSDMAYIGWRTWSCGSRFLQNNLKMPREQKFPARLQNIRKDTNKKNFAATSLELGMIVNLYPPFIERLSGSNCRLQKKSLRVPPSQYIRLSRSARQSRCAIKNQLKSHSLPARNWIKMLIT